MDKILDSMNNLATQYKINGIFEVHISVNCETNDDLELFLECCNKNNIKPIIIQLSNGENNKQVMTSSFITGVYKDVILTKTKDTVNRLFDNTRLKDKIVRVKIESLARNTGVPILENKEEDKYFEFHYKIVIKSNIEYDFIKSFVKNYDARISSNAFKHNNENAVKHYFITKRVHNAGQEYAMQQHEILKEALSINGFTPLKTEAEFVVFDSNYNLDKGWTI